MSITVVKERGVRMVNAVRVCVAPLLMIFFVGAALADTDKNKRLTVEFEHAKQAFERAAESMSTDEGSAAGLRKLKNTYEKKRAALDKARIDSLVEYSGREPRFIENLRGAGSSWVEISNELNVHPSVIGIELIDDRPPPFATP